MCYVARYTLYVLCSLVHIAPAPNICHQLYMLSSFSSCDVTRMYMSNMAAADNKLECLDESLKCRPNIGAVFLGAKYVKWTSSEHA